MLRALWPFGCLLALAACGANAGGSSANSAAAGSGSENVGEPAPPLPAATKGYELYAWDDAEGIRFTLITGTNRPKTAAELTLQDATVEDGEWVIVNRAGLSHLRQTLERVPAGTPVSLSHHPDLPALSDAHRASIEDALATAGL